MSVSLEKQTLTLIKTVGRDTHITWLEQDILVPDTKPDVMKVIRVEAIPLIGNVDVIDGAIRVSGEITYYVLYRSTEENKTKGISMTYPYTQTINVPDAKRGMHSRVGVNVRNTIYSLPNERKVSIKTELVFKYVVRELSDVSLIKGIDSGENIEHKESKEVFYNVLAIKNDVIDAREDIVLQSDMPKISEILRVNAGIVNTEYKVSYNKILVKGDVRVEIGYMSSDDGNSIHTYVINIPFTGMIEFENISENSKFDIKYNLRNLEIMLANQDSNMLTVSAEVAVEALMFEEKTVTYIDDFYSTSKNLRFETSNVAVIKNKTMLNKQISLKENLGSVDAGNKIINYTTDTGHLNTKISGGNLYVDGPLKVSAIFMNNETGVVDSKTFDLLVNTTIPLGMEMSEENVSVELTPAKQDVAIVGDNLEANIVLDAIIEMENVDKITLIGDIEESDMDENEFDSMYIYIIKKGDNLWSIAKKYKTTVAKITNINNISDENKIDIGQKILIIR